MINQLTSNWVCWAIVGLAFIGYHQLFTVNFDRRQPAIKKQFAGILIASLPLLGLLGTIIGLLDCFRALSQQSTGANLLSDGIADALLTTQLGLVCAIPGWILQSYYTKKQYSYGS